MHEVFFNEALQLAEINRGFCSPNPSVGSVVVKSGKIVSRGFHSGCGNPHAEVEALRPLGREAQGSDVYVTLEPCSITGRTPPCTDFLIQQRVARVFYAFQDPNPFINGNGKQQLCRAGIETKQIPFAPIESFYHSYYRWVTTGKPFVTLKLAVTLDGKYASTDGKSVRVSSPETDLITHQGRKHSDAILTTARTILLDNPQLNARIENEIYAKPIYILDRLLTIPLSSKIFTTASSVTLFFSEFLPQWKLSIIDTLRERGVVCEPLPTENERFDLAQCISRIGRDGVHDLWVEAGGELAHSLLSLGLVQRSLIYVSPDPLGGSGRSVMWNPHSFTKTDQIHWSQSGRDAVLEMIWNS